MMLKNKKSATTRGISSGGPRLVIVGSHSPSKSCAGWTGSAADSRGASRGGGGGWVTKGLAPLACTACTWARFCSTKLGFVGNRSPSERTFCAQPGGVAKRLLVRRFSCTSCFLDVFAGRSPFIFGSSSLSSNLRFPGVMARSMVSEDTGMCSLMLGTEGSLVLGLTDMLCSLSCIGGFVICDTEVCLCGCVGV
jgi:hypothetical protein